MAIEHYQLSDAPQKRIHPKPLDTLLMEGVTYPLTLQNGIFGYWRQGEDERDRTFIPVVKKDLLKHPVARGGATTWFIKPKGRERVRLDPSKDTQ